MGWGGVEECGDFDGVFVMVGRREWNGGVVLFFFWCVGGGGVIGGFDGVNLFGGFLLMVGLGWGYGDWWWCFLIFLGNCVVVGKRVMEFMVSWSVVYGCNMVLGEWLFRREKR